MIEALRHCGGIFPRVKDGFILRRVMKPETLCPFEERTGVVNFRRFGYDAEVTFQDEPDNPADREAVQVLADGLFIGYFYRSSTLRQLLRGIRRTDGIRYLARIVHTDRVVRFEVAIYVRFLPEEYDLIGTYKTISMKEVDCPVGTLFPISGPSWSIKYDWDLDVFSDPSCLPFSRAVLTHEGRPVGVVDLGSSFLPDGVQRKDGLLARLEERDGKDALVSVFRTGRAPERIHFF